MIDYLVVFAGILGTIAPFGALAAVIAYRCEAPTSEPPLDLKRLTYLAPLAAFAALVAAALISSPLLHALSVSGSSFEWAAAAVMVPLAIRLIVLGDSMSAPRWKLPRYSWLVPFSLPLLAGPVSIVAAISYSDRIGIIETIVASAIMLATVAALFVTLAFWEKQRLLIVQMLGRANGLLLGGMAVEMALDGLHRI
jgi:small neutral amino acid transporter SnatA (MarC family)